MGLNIIKRCLSCNHWVTFCIAAATAIVTIKTLMDSTCRHNIHAWLRAFSGCVLMIFCSVKFGKRWLYYYVLCVLHTPCNVLLLLCILLLWEWKILFVSLFLFAHKTSANWIKYCRKYKYEENKKGAFVGTQPKVIPIFIAEKISSLWYSQLQKATVAG